MKKSLFVLLICLFSLTGCQGLKYQVRETTISIQRKIVHHQRSVAQHKRERAMEKQKRNELRH